MPDFSIGGKTITEISVGGKTITEAWIRGKQVYSTGPALTLTIAGSVTGATVSHTTLTIASGQTGTYYVTANDNYDIAADDVTITETSGGDYYSSEKTYESANDRVKVVVTAATLTEDQDGTATLSGSATQTSYTYTLSFTDTSGDNITANNATQVVYTGAVGSSLASTSSTQKTLSADDGWEASSFTATGGGDAITPSVNQSTGVVTWTGTMPSGGGSGTIVMGGTATEIFDLTLSLTGTYTKCDDNVTSPLTIASGDTATITYTPSADYEFDAKTDVSIPATLPSGVSSIVNTLNSNGTITQVITANTLTADVSSSYDNDATATIITYTWTVQVVESLLNFDVTNSNIKVTYSGTVGADFSSGLTHTLKAGADYTYSSPSATPSNSAITTSINGSSLTWSGTVPSGGLSGNITITVSATLTEKSYTGTFLAPSPLPTGVEEYEYFPSGYTENAGDEVTFSVAIDTDYPSYGYDNGGTPLGGHTITNQTATIPSGGGDFVAYTATPPVYPMGRARLKPTDNVTGGVVGNGVNDQVGYPSGLSNTQSGFDEDTYDFTGVWTTDEITLKSGWFWVSGPTLGTAPSGTFDVDDDTNGDFDVFWTITGSVLQDVSVTTSAATSTSATGATLNGSVNSSGGAATSGGFYYQLLSDGATAPTASSLATNGTSVNAFSDLTDGKGNMSEAITFTGNASARDLYFVAWANNGNGNKYGSVTKADIPAQSQNNTAISVGVGSSAQIACAAGNETKYFDNSTLLNATTMYAQSTGTKLHAATWVSDGTTSRYWNGTAFGGLSQLCL